jgi:hypothetical protein
LFTDLSGQFSPSSSFILIFIRLVPQADEDEDNDEEDESALMKRLAFSTPTHKFGPFLPF